MWVPKLSKEKENGTKAESPTQQNFAYFFGFVFIFVTLVLY
jgi:hypothetical protein